LILKVKIVYFYADRIGGFRYNLAENYWVFSSWNSLKLEGQSPGMDRVKDYGFNGFLFGFQGRKY
jgi:hypothetical protein